MMARLLNKKAKAFVFFTFLIGIGFAQDITPVYKDYKDQGEYKKFRRYAITVGAWQINTLKEEGAIVVKLKTNKILIDQLLKNDNKKLAEEKQLEQFAINKNLMFAFKDNFNFCKLYFIYSSSSDSLLNGTRQGIFLDSNLTVDPSITMTEKFYLIAERDFIYSSSIGFVREDSARAVKEKGNPIVEVMPVIKNKYGHQLKRPFPYAGGGPGKHTSSLETSYYFPIQFRSSSMGAVSIQYSVDKTFLEEIKTRAEVKKSYLLKDDGSIKTTVKLNKSFTYEKLSISVADLNDRFFQFLRKYPKPDLRRIKVDVKPYLY